MLYVSECISTHIAVPDIVGSTSMGPEINIDSIMALEKQIEEGTEDVIQLKRARNSLLNISTRVPPEVLGHVFCWNVIPRREFGGFQKGSYNFLLVCHHWFEVARDTPELWNFWGNTLEQWSQRYQRSGTFPLDLMLFAPWHMLGSDPIAGAISFDGPLRDALRDRASSDSIRSILLKGMNTDLLHSVISSLTPDGEGARCSSVESLILECDSPGIFKFLACHRFPRLRDLCIRTSVRPPSWDHLKLLQATSLTTLSLDYWYIPTTLTTSKLLSTLASYPNLQDLSLFQSVLPHDIGDGSTVRVPLRHLKNLCLRGDCRDVFRLLERLEYPDTLDHVDLGLSERVDSVERITESIAPYLQDRIRRDDRFQGRLRIHVSPGRSETIFKVEFNIPTIPPWHSYPSMSFKALFRNDLPQGTREKLCTSLAPLIPREHVVALAGDLDTHAMRDLVVTMPNIEDLSLTRSAISDMFPRPNPPSHMKLFPSLRYLCLYYPTLQNDNDWSPFVNYLAHQTSDGQAISLWIYVRHIPPEVVREIENLVEEFNLNYTRTW